MWIIKSMSDMVDPCSSILMRMSSRLTIQMSGSSLLEASLEFTNSFFSAIKLGALFVAYLFCRRLQANLASPYAMSFVLLRRIKLNATRPFAVEPSTLKIRSVNACSLASRAFFLSLPSSVVSSKFSSSFGAISAPRRILR